MDKPLDADLDTEIFTDGQFVDWIADIYLVQIARELIIFAEGINEASDRSPRFYGRVFVHMAAHGLHRTLYGADDDTRAKAITELLKGIRDGLTVQNPPQSSGRLN